MQLILLQIKREETKKHEERKRKSLLQNKLETGK